MLLTLALRIGTLLILILMSAAITTGQQPAQATERRQGQLLQLPVWYVLGPDDQIVLQGLNAEEIVNRPMRIDPSGEIGLPMVGRLRAAGLTIQQFEQELNQRLSIYIREPRISVSVTEYRSQPVSVLGAVNSPGVLQVQGRKTLMELLSLAGGLRPDAGYRVKITRGVEWGPIPLPNAAPDSTGKFNVAEVTIKGLMEAKNPEANILIMPHDVISVPVAELVYVIGDVKKAGGFTLHERETMSVLQALSLAEGLQSTADAKRAKILRLPPDGEDRQEIPVNVKEILAGKSQDVTLQGGDILFVPDSTGKKVGYRTLDAIINVVTGVAIWRR